MKSRIVLWVAVGIAIYVGATLYHSSIIKQYEEPATIEPDHVQMLRLQDAKARARLRIIKERAREQLAQDKAQFIEEAKIRARLQLARARARELLAKQKESLKQASSVAVPIASPDQGMVAGERKKIEMLNKQLGQTQSALQLQSSSNRVQMTVLEERIAKANELIITQRKELSDTQAERKKLLLQTGEKDVNLAILQNRIKHLEQGLEQKNLELRKNYSDLAITKKKIEKALLVEVKAKGLELLLDGLRQDLTSTQSKLAVANSRIVSLSTTNVQSTNELKKVEVDLNVTRDKLAKLETAHRQTIRLAEGYQDELTRLNSAKQDGFVHASSLEEQLDAASTRITILEMELDRAKLKASAMLEFGQENERLITPSKQQIGVLKNLLNNKQQALDQALSRIDILKGKQSSLQLMLKEQS
ncbi:MAG: hypothetical protein OEM02_16740, partial [Desulfobulbaceae bacterium]|nr:hypothetical protein [Desulfobulbaceae bacterium]